MKRIILAILLATVLLPLGGCFIVERHHDRDGYYRGERYDRHDRHEREHEERYER